jgi:hypothetical protein
MPGVVVHLAHRQHAVLLSRRCCVSGLMGASRFRETSENGSNLMTGGA